MFLCLPWTAFPIFSRTTGTPGIHSFIIHTFSSLGPYFLLLNLLRSSHLKQIKDFFMLFFLSWIAFLFIMCSSFHIFISLNFMHCGLCPHTSVEIALLKITNTICTVVPPYPQEIHSKTPSGSLNPWIVPTPYILFFPIHTYLSDLW